MEEGGTGLEAEAEEGELEGRVGGGGRVGGASGGGQHGTGGRGRGGRVGGTADLEATLSHSLPLLS